MPKGQSRIVQLRRADSDEIVLFDSIAQAAAWEDVAPPTMRKAVMNGTPLQNGTVAAFQGDPLPAQAPDISEAPMPMPEPQESEEESGDAPDMTAEQMLWFASQLREHAKEILNHAKALEKSARELEQ